MSGGETSMKIYERVTTTIAGLGYLFLGMLAIWVSVSRRSTEALIRFFEWINANFSWQNLLIIIPSFILFILLVDIAFKNRSLDQFIVRETSLGHVKVSMLTVENLARRVVRQIEGVKEVDTFIDGSSDGVSIELHVLAHADVNIPEVCEEIESKLAHYINETVGIPVTGVETYVRNTVEPKGTTKSSKSRIE